MLRQAARAARCLGGALQQRGAIGANACKFKGLLIEEGAQHVSASYTLPACVSPWQQQFRCFAAKGTGEAPSEEGQAKQEAEQSPASSSSEDDQAEAPNMDELTATLPEREKAMAEMQTKVEEMTDSLKRSLAEMENLRERTRREVDTAKKFAIQGFVKTILDVADNMGRALDAVPAEALNAEEDGEKGNNKPLQLLKALHEGVQATEKILLQALKQHGVEQYNPVNDKFDPNLHMALFEVPDPAKEPGTVGIVHKRGYKMHDRVLRAAEVGVVVKPPS